jgi:hypothetical protein
MLDDLNSGNPFALLPYFGSIYIEKNGNRKESDADEAQKATCPRHTEFCIHDMRKERKESAKEAPNESVYRNCRVGIEAVAIDQV